MSLKAALLHLLLLFFFCLTEAQNTLNLKVRSNTTSQAYLESPSTQRLTGNHPLLVARSVNALAAGKKQGSESREIDRVFSIDIDGENPYAVIADLQATGEFEWVELNRKIELPGFGVGRKNGLNPPPKDNLNRGGWYQNERRIEAEPPNDDSLSLQWYHDYIGTFSAWDTTRGDSNIVVGIIDTGLDYDHPEFFGQVAISQAEDANGNGRFDPWPDSVLVNGVTGDFDGIDADGNGYIDDVIGYDFTDQPNSPFGGDFLFEDPNPYDDNDHGTLVAGIINARADNSYGGAGIAPGCKIKVLRAFAANGGGEDDDIARAIVYAADNNISILNFSFGDIYPSQMMHEAIKYAYARNVVMIGSSGNGTGDNIHYPSNFDEVISVAASAVSSSSGNEILWPLSSFGWTVSLAAPGSGIYTTVVRDTSDEEDDPFGTFSGTSTAAPMVSAATALLFSQRGACSPQQVRGILTASADDISNEGWDHLTGAGRLNIPRALATVGGSNVSILSPRNDAGSANASVPVRVTALDPEFESMDLEYQAELSGGSEWISLETGLTDQVNDEMIHEWDISVLTDGEYTLRLRVNKTNGRTAEDRIRFVVDRTAPEIQIKVAKATWDNDKRKLMVVYRSSDRGVMKLHFRPLGQTEERVLVFDRITRNGHFLIGEELLSAGDIEYYLSVTNESGLTDTTAIQQFTFSPTAISSHLFDTLDYSIPMGHYLAKTTDMDGDGLKEVVMSQYDDRLSFGGLTFWEYNGVAFSQADSLEFKPILIPKDIADRDNNGLLELLCSVNDSLYVLEQDASNGFPSEIIADDLGNGNFAARFGDTDGDGTVELITKDFQDYRILKPNGSGFDLEATLADISPDYEGSVAPRSLVEDFDGDGQVEIVFGDFDGDILVYEFDGTDYVNRLIDTTDLSRSGTYMTAGDFDGDGQMEFAVAAHTRLNRNEADFEYESPYWLVRIFKATGNDTYSILWEDYFFDIDTDGFNAISSGNLDNDLEDELIFSTFPRDYIFEWNGSEMEPSWFWYGNLTTHHLVEDFNGNGVKEVAIGRGDKALFYEKDVTYTGPEPVRTLTGLVLDEARIQLKWESLASANEYRVWRGELDGGPIFINLIDSTSSINFIDTGLVAGTEYLYVLESKNSSLSPAYSIFSNSVVLQPHTNGRLDSVVAVSAEQIRVYFNVPVKADASDLPRFVVNGDQFPFSVLSSGDANQSLLLSFSEQFLSSNLLLVDSTFLDAQNGLIDPSSLLQPFDWLEDATQSAFFSRWEIVDGKTARIWFNEPMTNSVLDIARYDLQPVGKVIEVNFSDGLQQSIDVTIEEAVFGAIGYPVSVILNGGEALSGAQMLEKEGNVATFSASQSDLSQVYVYPNPYQGNDFFDGIRFANLVERCTVTVYTPSGQKVAVLQEADGDGGLEWNLQSISGERVRPGVYLYRVETEEGQEALGTFSILQ